MKKIRKITAVLSLSVVLLASCTVQKRLHNPGFHVQFDKKYKTDKTDITKKATKAHTVEIAKADDKQELEESQVEALKEIIISNTSVAAENVALTETSKDVATVENTIIPPTQTTVKKNTTVNAIKTAATTKYTAVSSKVSKKDTAKVNSATAAAGQASGGLLVVFVILCLFPFINLIPVYLTDGSITMNFWVTLILDILGALPGIIFALLVVLGVVSL